MRSSALIIWFKVIESTAAIADLVDPIEGIFEVKIEPERKLIQALLSPSKPSISSLAARALSGSPCLDGAEGGLWSRLGCACGHRV